MRHPRLGQLLEDFNKPPPQGHYNTRLDAWANTVTGVGTSRDKVTATGFAEEGQLPFALLDQLYHNDDMAARIVDLFPETALREEFFLTGKDGKTADEVMQRIYDLDACDMFLNAWCQARLHGGSAVIMGMSGAPATPAVDGEVNSLFLVDRFALAVHKFYGKTNQPNYGTPELYRIVRPRLYGAGAAEVEQPDPNEIIHESRLIVFPGARTSPRRKLANGYWDDSVLQRVYQVVQAYGITWASVVHLLQDAAQGVFKMKDLWNMIVGGNKDAVEERMQIVDEQRSVSRSILVDADSEDFTRVPTPFTGIPELIDRISERMSSASEYPLTVLMGSSPGGMNATGDSDLEIFYGRTGNKQKKVLTPRILKLAARLGGKDLKVNYPPLRLPSAEEVAKTRYLQAQTDNLYKADLVLSSDEIRKNRFTEHGWSSETVINPADKTPATVADELMAAAAAAAAAAADPDAPPPAGGTKAPAGSTLVNTHRFSQKYGR